MYSAGDRVSASSARTCGLDILQSDYLKNFVNSGCQTREEDRRRSHRRLGQKGTYSTSSSNICGRLSEQTYCFLVVMFMNSIFFSTMSVVQLVFFISASFVIWSISR